MARRGHLRGMDDVHCDAMTPEQAATELPRGMIFASGEAEDADTAFDMAQRHLWAAIARDGNPGVLNIEHSVTTRQVQVHELKGIEEWETQTRQAAMVIVTLLATVIRATEEVTS